MIVRYTVEGWEIITQRNHGLLAAEICARWKINDQPARWVETLIACGGHDDAFNELENGSLLTTKGGPINFDMNNFDEQLSQLLINMALTKSSFIALLTARHIAFTHGNEVKARKFLTMLKKKEESWIAAAQSSQKEVQEAYQLLEFCDAFSLLICQDRIQPESRTMEISTGPDGTRYQVICSGESLIVKPWPFEEKQFRVSYELRKLKKLEFKNDEEFRHYLYEAKPEQITIDLRKN